MSQQPKHPDLFDRDLEDPAGDPPTGTYVPPDEPLGSHSYGTTRAEARAGETFAERDRHTEPEEETHSGASGTGQLLQEGDQDVDLGDGDASMFAWVEGDEGDLSAEEQAMHTSGEP